MAAQFPEGEGLSWPRACAVDLESGASSWHSCAGPPHRGCVQPGALWPLPTDWGSDNGGAWHVACGRLAQLVRALPLQGRSPAFESPTAHLDGLHSSE